MKITFQKEHNYTPDFELAKNVYLECKGRFVAADRAKHLYIKEQHPEITVYFLFERPNQKLSKRSNTSYAQWCEKWGFQYTTLEQGIPKEWSKKRK